MNNSVVKTIARVNNVAIQVNHESAEKWVPIRPICEALNVDFPTQFGKIKEHPILASTVGLIPMVAADEKDRNMQCLPIEYVFGWLFTIHPNNVKEEAREALIRYQKECYHALFRYFSNKSDFLQDKQNLIEEKVDKYQAIQVEFKTAKDRLARAKEELNQARAYSYEQWEAKALQGKLEFTEFQTVKE